MQRGAFPYHKLGKKLEEIRHRSKQTIPEVSGAIEVDYETLIRYEKGVERPTEDILMLMINYYCIIDKEADEIWEIAGYDHTTPDATAQVPALLLMPLDGRVVYSDGAQVNVNNFGVVVNFLQAGVNGDPMAISRIGMSIEHAKSLAELLYKTIAESEKPKMPKALPIPVQKKTRRK